MRMNGRVRALLEESIRLELNAADLYMLFFHRFPEDADLWWKLVIEEKNHAALLKSIRDIFTESAGMPDTLLADSLAELVRINGLAGNMLESFTDSTPSREDALNSAIRLEMSAGEAHFQKFMGSSASDNRIEEVFRQLNGADMDHAERIRRYMEENGIQVEDGLQD